MTSWPVVEHTTGYELEREIGASGAAVIAGVDEAGRGAWAGPVVVCAAVVRPGFPPAPDGLTDSKRLTAKRRAELAAELPAWVKADLRSVSVAAASVLAKVYRDNLMAVLGESCPGFAFAENAGYPAPVHQQALAAHGPSPYHRLSWSYLDDLPAWRHLRKHRPAIEGQLSLL